MIEVSVTGTTLRRHIDKFVLALALVGMLCVAAKSQALRCGDPSPSFHKGEPSYAGLEGTSFPRGETIGTLKFYLNAIEGRWLGSGDVLDCNGQSQRHPSRLELETEGSLAEDYKIRKEMEDRQDNIVRNDHYFLELDGDKIKFNGLSNIELLALSQEQFQFRTKFNIVARGGAAVSRELVFRFWRDGDSLIYEESVYSQGVLEWQGSWALERVF